MTKKSSISRIHEFELMYWDTVIQVLGVWQNTYQPAPMQKDSETTSQSEISWAEFTLLAAAGFGLGIIIGAISRLF